MRKIYPLVAGFFLCLASLKTSSQQQISAALSEVQDAVWKASSPLEPVNDIRITNQTETKTESNTTMVDCQADFEMNPSPNSPLHQKFSAIPSISEQKRPVYICWTFGDGKDTCIQYLNTSTGPYPVVHTYQQPGEYEVCVKIVYDGGCEATKCKKIIVAKPDECKIDFERLLISSASHPLQVYYKAFPWHNNNKKPLRLCWKFGDGKDTCIEYPESFTGTYAVNHTYQQPGHYEVCIKAVYQGGCETYTCKRIQITNPDTCGIEIEKLPLTPGTNPVVTGFKALPTLTNTRVPKLICWTFGDGQDTCVEYAQNFYGPYLIYHQYATAGNYEVCVKVIYYGGCEAKICKPVQVGRPDECKINFEKISPTLTNNPLLVYYKALPAHNNNKKPKQICWYFGDGRDTCITYPENYSGYYTVKHQYREPRNYEVCVKVIYYGGCEAKICKPVQVGRPDECKIDFEKISPTLTNNPLLVYYKALPAHNNNKKPKQICWYFGDGRDTCITYPENYSGDYLVRHEYRESGNYEVCIKVQYYGGCEAKNCKIIQVGRPIECKADFERIPLTSVNHPLQVAFRALPWHSNNKKPKQICWYFGDGRDTCIEYPENYAGSYSVAHNYRQPGKYEVCIKIFYYGGCEAKNCEVVYLEGPGECLVKVAELTPSITSLTRGIVIKPWSSLNKKPLAICVKFGDGSDTCIQSSATNPLPEELIIRHTYPAPGLYRTCVKVLFDGGCYAYECIEVVIRGGNNTCGGYMTDSLVSPKTVRFRGFAVNNQNDPVVEYRWNFGDGSGAAGKEVTHSYHAPGTYEVCLQIITQRSCITKICKKLIVPGDIRPVLQLSPNPVSATLHISFYSAYSETINIKIVNSNGVVLKSYAKSITVGNNSWDLDVAVLMPGTYTLYIQSANQLASQLFIKN